MNVLIGFACSSILRQFFQDKGHNVWSCDLKDSADGKNHLKGDIRLFLGSCEQNRGGQWDLLIAHPPCTFLANSGSQWLSHPDDVKLPYEQRRPNPFYPTRRQDRQEAIELFKIVKNSGIAKKCLENPVPFRKEDIGNYNQIVQPYFFGDPFTKPTCLWLQNLPRLNATNIVDPGEYVTFSSGKRQPKWYADAKKGNKELTQTIRSVTFPGMAKAMADQWG